MSVLIVKRKKESGTKKKRKKWTPLFLRAILVQKNFKEYNELEYKITLF